MNKWRNLCFYSKRVAEKDGLHAQSLILKKKLPFLMFCVCSSFNILISFFKFKIIFFEIALCRNNIHRRNRKWWTAGAVYLFMAGPSFYCLSTYGSLLWVTLATFFLHFSFCFATVKLLQSIGSIEFFCVTYLIRGRYRAISYLITLPN